MSNPHYQPTPADGRPAELSGEERSMAIIAHLSAPVAFVLSAGLLSFVGPLIVWAIYKDRSPGVRRAAAGAFNFNLATWLLIIVGWVLFFTVIGLPLALVLWLVVFVVAAVCHVIGAVRASRGEAYDYPFQIPVLR